ncbi:hypothetical protein [Aeromonas hydrophila]|uniref:hypothetical protein n=1 Tax=Aeromonas hydrophila TaxID=644 RepID=UPI0014742533|nr:hypothetical protein [Aeromonas hydrophila]
MNKKLKLLPHWLNMYFSWSMVGKTSMASTPFLPSDTFFACLFSGAGTLLGMYVVH